jgi:hypothetical protein
MAGWPAWPAELGPLVAIRFSFKHLYIPSRYVYETKLSI